jgi:MoxR-like ATPase
LSNIEASNLNEPLDEIKKTASNAIDEFDKILRLKKTAKEETEAVEKRAKALLSKAKNTRVAQVNDSVHLLAELRHSKGEIVGLESLRFVDANKVKALNEQISEAFTHASEHCVTFLMKPEALNPYRDKVTSIEKELESLQKVVVANDLEKEIEDLSKELALLIEIVSNLKILDATKTTQIIDSITALFSDFNQINAALRKKRKSLLLVEGKAEFNAQIRLINQGFINYIDIVDTPDKAGEYLNKLIVQLEELEGKFADFEEYLIQIEEKREEIYNAFESKKTALVEASNKKAQSYYSSGERILNGIKNRAATFDNVVDINGYFASDLMVDKVRDIIKNLIGLNDSIKADDIQSKLKTVKEDAIRQLKDKNELFVDGGSTIKFGNHQFLVNTQKLDVTTVLKGEELYFHLTGTNFYEKIENEQLEETRSVWNQGLISENKAVYRGEFLAYGLYQFVLSPEMGLLHWIQLTDDEKLTILQKQISKRFNEGYVKGVHDHDALLILNELIRKEETIGLLKYSANERIGALLFWEYGIDPNEKSRIQNQLKAFGMLKSVFKDKSANEFLQEQLLEQITANAQNSPMEADWERAVSYIMEEISSSDKYIVSQPAKELADQFKSFLTTQRKTKTFNTAIFQNEGNWDDRYNGIELWLNAFLRTKEQIAANTVIAEAAFYILLNNDERFYHSPANVTATIEDLRGEHEVIEENGYHLNYNDFVTKLISFNKNEVVWFKAYNQVKKDLTHAFKEDIRLNEYKPRVLSSFVRNKLIDKVYLSLIGDNLAKQIGAAGATKRTDLMGMLLLISPPGYGKTTLMEYIASRLGLVFMKINGPALGHNVVSLDPQDADNAASREEVEKLNLALEMGDNVMLYLDDIQHCNPEFLQKFISLSDGQRKIEGVYKGNTKTYDFRGKKIVVVMAGNPYTESGDKFRVPDMLSNRADIYNLGDILGDSAEEFKLSYLENSMTSNAVLGALADKGRDDMHSLIHVAGGMPIEQVELKASYSSEELQDINALLEMSIKVRDILLKVNLMYIESAGQEDSYRTEPAFKLQGSYRDMNKMVEKLNPFMNDKELDTLIMSHYQNEAQTLTTGAEANLLKLKELIEVISEEEAARWAVIKEEFVEMQKLKGYGDTSGEMIQVIRKMGDINKSLTNLGKDEVNEDYIIQLKSITEGVRAISKVMIENRKNRPNSEEEE